MRRIARFWKIIILDTLGVLLMVTALAIGWLPGPGGIPLFLVGLGLLAINHDWAKRYIDVLQDYADRLGDLIFVSDKRAQAAYDVLGPVLLASGLWLMYQHPRVWITSVGLSLTCLGIVVLLGNRNRWQRIKQNFNHKH